MRMVDFIDHSHDHASFSLLFRPSSPHGGKRCVLHIALEWNAFDQLRARARNSICGQVRRFDG
jgi:hypothetical protein